MSSNFAEQLRPPASEHPDHPAIKLDDLVLNYQLLDEATARAAGLLRSRGVEVGDRVGMQLPNVPYFPVVYFGALRLGAVVVPMNPLLKEREVAYHLSDSGTRLLLGWHQFHDPCTAGASEAGAQCILVEPGGVREAVVLGRACWRDRATIRQRPGGDHLHVGDHGDPQGRDAHPRKSQGRRGRGPRSRRRRRPMVTVATLPLFHVFGMSAIMNVTLRAHGLLTLVPRFDPAKVLEVIERDGATTFGGVPTLYQALGPPPPRA